MEWACDTSCAAHMGCSPTDKLEHGLEARIGTEELHDL